MQGPRLDALVTPFLVPVLAFFVVRSSAGCRVAFGSLEPINQGVAYKWLLSAPLNAS